ncbi:hypothetical protein ACFSCX_06125 [Bacillus salitolerans]|uniref:Uncharacterized protein n=1 Tax=Bacillus salitolerans TaxID=1437434 RepID=A0ABW4LQ19_9BACI
MLLKIIGILLLAYCVTSLLFTFYIKIFRKDVKQQLDKDTKVKYLNRALNQLENYKNLAKQNPNKSYEMKINNYYGVLRHGCRRPFFSDYLSDEDLELLKKMFKGSQVELDYYYSDLSKCLVLNVRYPLHTTNH